MATLALIQHYLEYLRSPPVLLTILIILGPILLEVFTHKRLASSRTPSRIQGCFRLGISKRSNLDDQHVRQHGPNSSTASESATATAHVKALFTYPVKSCRGVELAASEVLATGLKYDRLFTFAQLVPKQQDIFDLASVSESSNAASDKSEHKWRFITQREFPRLALLETELWVPDPRASEHTVPNGEMSKDSKSSPKLQTGRSNDRNGKHAVSVHQAAQDFEQTTEKTWAAHGGALIIRFPFEPSFNPMGLRTETVSVRVPLVPSAQHAADKEYTSEQLSIWTDSPQAFNISGEFDATVLARLKSFIGVSHPLGLFRVDHSNRREITRSLPKDQPDGKYTIGFADAFPFHILNLASVRALDGDLPDKNSQKHTLDARRFRANVYITGPSAYAEDSWKRVTIGRCVKPRKDGKKITETDGEYHVACRTARCKLPNVDQTTGVRDRSEPSTTLGRTRKVDKGAYPHPCLGMQMIPLFQQGILRVGDEVRVLERGEHVYEKMFP